MALASPCLSSLTLRNNYHFWNVEVNIVDLISACIRALVVFGSQMGSVPVFEILRLSSTIIIKKSESTVRKKIGQKIP